MRNKLLILHFLFLLCTFAAMVVAFQGFNPWVMAALTTMPLLFAVLIFRNWMAYVNDVLGKSDKALNIDSDNLNINWSGKLDRLIQNQNLAKQKFELSAKMISNLSQSDKVDSIDELLKEDPIGKALQNIKIEMRQLKEEDEKQAWITNGLAKFSSILRDKVEVGQYAQNIISYLIKYLNANQGGLYIENKDEHGERYLELIACYAYGKKKFVDGKIFESQGILGQCMQEKDFLFITDVPTNYVKITSGLGEATPRNIIVAPLIFNDVFCGAIEIASFQVLKPYEVEFLKKICEDIASEVASLKNVQHTQQLLQESSKLALELQAREEEMRQSMEELAATQDEMSRKQIELSGIINALDSTLGTVEFNVQGKIIKHNSILAQFLDSNKDQLLQKDFTMVIGNSNRNLWDQIVSGSLRSGDFQTHTLVSKDVWLSATFTPVMNSDGKIIKILSMIQDITQKKIKETEFQRLSLVANNTDNAVVITNREGLIEYVNEGFCKITGYSLGEVEGKKPGSFLQGEESNQETISRIRVLLKERKPIYEEILNYNKNGEPYWVSLVINPIFDEQNELVNYISVQANITETKTSSLDFKYKLEAISRSNTIIEFDTNGIILDANENFLKLTEYSLDEIVGKHHRIFLSSNDDNNADYIQFWKQLSSGQSISSEFSRKTKNGKIIWMRGIYNPILDMHGRTKKIVKFAINITNEHFLQAEANRKQLELNGYLNGVNNTIASVEFTLEGKLITANEIFTKVLGYSEKELLSMDYLSLMTEDHSAIMMWENLKVGKFFSGEFKMNNKDGKEFWLSGTFNPITIDANKPEKILMLAQFTTQEKEKLNDLNTMVHVFKSTLPVIEFTNTFMCKSANEIAMKLFGISRMELKSKGLTNFIAPYYLPNWEKIKNNFTTDEVAFLNLPLLRGSKVATYEVSISAIKNMDGTISKYIVLLVREMHDQVPLLAVG